MPRSSSPPKYKRIQSKLAVLRVEQPNLPKRELCKVLKCDYRTLQKALADVEPEIALAQKSLRDRFTERIVECKPPERIADDYIAIADSKRVQASVRLAALGALAKAIGVDGEESRAGDVDHRSLFHIEGGAHVTVYVPAPAQDASAPSDAVTHDVTARDVADSDDQDD